MKIDKNIPIPKAWSRTKLDGIHDALCDMEKGDSVYFVIYKEAVRMRARASNYINGNYRDFANKDFVIRKYKDGWRVWRTR